jgi:hypothetical protein
VRSLVLRISHQPSPLQRVPPPSVVAPPGGLPPEPGAPDEPPEPPPSGFPPEPVEPPVLPPLEPLAPPVLILPPVPPAPLVPPLLAPEAPLPGAPLAPALPPVADPSAGEPVFSLEEHAYDNADANVSAAQPIPTLSTTGIRRTCLHEAWGMTHLRTDGGPERPTESRLARHSNRSRVWRVWNWRRPMHAVEPH